MSGLIGIQVTESASCPRLLPGARDLGFELGGGPRRHTGNQAAREFLPDEILNDSVIFPPDAILDRLYFTADLGDAEDLYDEAWQRVQDSMA